MSGAGPDETGDRPPAADLVIETASATTAETAAVTAVVAAALAEAAAEDQLPETTRSDWDRSSRAIRSPLGRGAGAWRTFNG